jgi:hypothetical protein
MVKELKTIPGDQFQKCFQQWKHRLIECVDAHGVTLKVIVAVNLQVSKDNFNVVIPGIKLSQWYSFRILINTPSP